MESSNLYMDRSWYETAVRSNQAESTNIVITKSIGSFWDGGKGFKRKAYITEVAGYFHYLQIVLILAMTSSKDFQKLGMKLGNIKTT